MKIRLFLFLNKTCYLLIYERERERDEIIIIHKFKGESQSLLVVDTYFHDTYFYKPNSCIVLYYIFFLLSMAQTHVNILEKLRECDLEGMGWFLSDLLHKPNPSMLSSR